MIDEPHKDEVINVIRMTEEIYKALSPVQKRNLAGHAYHVLQFLDRIKERARLSKEKST